MVTPDSFRGEPPIKSRALGLLSATLLLLVLLGATCLAFTLSPAPAPRGGIRLYDPANAPRACGALAAGACVFSMLHALCFRPRRRCGSPGTGVRWTLAALAMCVGCVVAAGLGMALSGSVNYSIRVDNMLLRVGMPWGHVLATSGAAAIGASVGVETQMRMLGADGGCLGPRATVPLIAALAGALLAMHYRASVDSLAFGTGVGEPWLMALFTDAAIFMFSSLVLKRLASSDR